MQNVRQDHQPIHFRLEHAIEVGARHLFERLPTVHPVIARSVNHAVDPAESLLHLVDCCTHLIGVAHVRAHEQNLRTQFVELLT